MGVFAGAIVGALAGAWAVALVAASRAKGVKGDLLAAVLAILPVAYYLVPDSVAPKPGSLARSLGWVTTAADGVGMSVTILLVGLLVYVLAGRLGLLRRLTARLDTRTQPDHPD